MPFKSKNTEGFRVVLQGFTFPVQELFLEDVLEKTRYRVGADQQPSSNYGGQRRRTQEKKRDPITQAFEVTTPLPHTHSVGVEL